MKAKAPSIKKAEQREHYPVSLQQEGVYLQSLLDPDNTVWNTSHSWRYTGPFDPDAFTHAVRDLIRRHASLRTNFFLQKEDILQAVRETVSLDAYYTFEDLSTLPESARQTTARKIEETAAKRPYNLVSDPLIRFTVVRLGPSDHVIVIGKHHIISDAASRQLLWRELVSFYNGRVIGEPYDPEPLEIQYHDYAVWEREFVTSPPYLETRKYWLEQLDGPLPLLNLPTDFPRGEDRRAGTVIAQEMLDGPLTARLRSFGLRNRMTFSTAFLAAFYVLLNRYCGQSDMVIGGLYRGRNKDRNLSRIIGLFANRIAMRLALGDPGDLPVKELLSRVDKQVVGAYKNQDFLFEDLIRTIHPPRTETHAPVFQAVFNMVKVPAADFDFHGLERVEWRGFDLDTNITSQYDLSLYIRDDLETLTIKLLYSKNLFRAETVERILAGYITVLSEIVTHPEQPVSALEIVTPGEKRRLLIDLNDTAMDYPADKTIHRLLEEQSARTPDAVALNMSDRTYTTHLTYKELNCHAGRLAGSLQSRGVGPGSIVGLKVKRSFDMIVGIYGILKTGAAYLPMDPVYPQDRIDFMLKDSGAKIHIDSCRDAIDRVRNESGGDRFGRDKSRPYRIASHNLAYVIYTSGSTGRPKGVMVPHRAVHNFIAGIAAIIDFAPHKTILALTTVSFDIFVLETLLPLSRGLRVVIADEKQQLEMELLEELIVKCRVDMLQATPTRMQLFTGTGSLRGLKEIMVGGEAFPPPLLRELRQLTPARIYNMYGPTETTVWSAVRDLTDAEAVDIGTPIANTQIHILDRHHNLQPMGAAGELCIAGHGLAVGYLNRPELTAQRFFNKSYRSYKTYWSYKTGDLARWLNDGCIEHLGRIDNQVKIRGFRIEPGEIEAVLDKHPTVAESVVLARQSSPGTMGLYAYVVPADGKAPDMSRLRDYLGETLPPYMVPSYFVQLEKIPLTQNGKIDRNALPVPGAGEFIAGGTGYKAPETPLQETMVSVWQDVLGLERIGIDDNFIALGGDSIKGIQVSSRLSAHGYRLDIAILFKYLTVRAVSPHVEKTAAGNAITSPPESHSLDRWGEILETLKENFDLENIDNIYYLSPMQEGMLFHYLYDPGNNAYIVQINYLLEGDVDADLFEKSCRQLVGHHDVFRTAFVHNQLERPVQVVLKERDTAYSYHDVSHSPGISGDAGDGTGHVRRIAAADREKGFDILNDALIRFTLIKTGDRVYWLSVTFHHIIMDGWSINLWLKDLLTLYRHGGVRPQGEYRRYPYAGYLEWLEAQDIDTAHNYWREYLGTFEQVTPVRPSAATTETKYLRQEHTVHVPRETYDRLSGMAVESGVTLNNVMQGVWGVVLQRRTGSDDVLFGNVISGRSIQLEGVERITGLFINTIPMRIKIEDARGETFTRMLGRIRDNIMESQGYGYLQLAEIQGLAPVEGPLFDHIYIYENYPVNRKLSSPEQVKKTGFKLTRKYSIERTNYDLNVIVIPRRDLLIRFVYNENVYDHSFIAGLAGHVQRVIEEVLDRPDLPLADIEMLTEEEKHRLLHQFNDTAMDYPAEKTIHRLLEEQAARTPDSIALNMSNKSYTTHMTYQELNRRSAHLAAHLHGKGVRPGDIVGLRVGRSFDMMVGIYGILKAGAAYLPIDPAYPEERIDYMLKDSNAKVTINDSCKDAIYRVRNQSGGDRFGRDKSRPYRIASHNLAYVIYTSGSTGKPKGVVIPHRAVHNFIAGIAAIIDFTPRKTILALTTVSFDIFVLETLLPLSRGSRVVIADEKQQLEMPLLETLIVKSRVDMLQATPTRMQMFVNTESPVSCLKGLSEIMVGGEAFPDPLLRELKQSTPARIYNMYGPTETTVWSSVKELTHAEAVDIGTPIANTQIHILDRHHNLLPEGAPGELCIAGHGLATGYLNRPELTAERFFNKSYRSYKTYWSYKTGDLARWLPDAHIVHLGRLDHQVKIRGNRIELGEIEAALNKHPAVKESVTVAVNDTSGKTLCAYLVPTGAGDEDMTVEQLRDFLGETLPDYMIPSYFIPIEKIPLTANGKVDRKSLPAPGHTIRTGAAYEAPTTPTEEKLVSIWRDILKVETIGIHDSFFTLGGHSLRVMNLAAQIKKTFEVNVPLRELFDNPTIAQIAGIITKNEEQREKFEQILQEIEGLSDDQVRALLG